MNQDDTLPFYDGCGRWIKLEQGEKYTCSVREGYILALKYGETEEIKPVFSGKLKVFKKAVRMAE
ncbi:hypothetical protein [Candidatus Enterococcus leclercqii]|uniref:hypothetical protein n=1 Tax=Candidatus Enterococcus leclercqii TaxID=1857218 RepID=UPI001379F682|nr:hypothetical protein [Enterococcus sp. CU9D]KAF1294163.1 hypothetical protein BAU14_07180 [Enterococcus sp. CU9D]